MRAGSSSSSASSWSARTRRLRIIDIQYHLLHELTDPADYLAVELAVGGRAAQLPGYEAYQRLYVGRVEPERVVEFLLLHPSFPRSCRFCLEAAARALAAIEGPVPGRGLSKVDRILGQVLSDLKFAELDQILQSDLHTFLGECPGTLRPGDASRAGTVLPPLIAW